MYVTSYYNTCHVSGCVTMLFALLFSLLMVLINCRAARKAMPPLMGIHFQDHWLWLSFLYWELNLAQQTLHGLTGLTGLWKRLRERVVEPKPVKDLTGTCTMTWLYYTRGMAHAAHAQWNKHNKTIINNYYWLIHGCWNWLSILYFLSW